VADAPVDELITEAQGTAKLWLIELVASAPLASAADLPVAELAREAPALCTAVARALSDDVELARLGPDGDRAALAGRAGRLAGADDPEGVAGAVEALRTVTWAAIMAALPQPSVVQVAELAERLAHVSQTILAGALRELARAQPEPRGDVVSQPTSEPRGDRVSRYAVAKPPVDLPADASVSLRDARGPTRAPTESASGMPWIVALERRLERQAEDGEPLAGLLVELDGIDRLLAIQTGDEVSTAIEAVERAVSGQLRPADALVRESLGRYWIVAPHTDRGAARGLADRLDAAVRASAKHRGAPLTVSIGIAVSPADGTEAQALAELAEEDLLAARADGRATSGRPVEEGPGR
jgi:GGDEF domain-containing protein